MEPVHHQTPYQQNTNAYNPPLAGVTPSGNVPYYPPPQYPAPPQQQQQQSVPYYPPPSGGMSGYGPPDDQNPNYL